MDFNKFIDTCWIIISIALLYGIFGLQAHHVNAMAWDMRSRDYWGKKAFILSVSWIILGGLGLAGFAGVAFGIKELMPLRDFIHEVLCGLA